MNLEGKNALVTGGSRGLGRALTAALAECGARVVAVARDLEPLREAVRAIRERGHTAHALRGDVGEISQMGALAASAAALIGPIDILIHNASNLGPVPLQLFMD